MLDILKIAGIYTALILGAGFASGQEILCFFIKFGLKGFWGLFLSGIIFSCLGYIVCDMAYKKKIHSSHKFLRFIFSDFYLASQFIIKIFLFMSYSTMLSATGAFFKQQFGLENITGIIFMSILCFLLSLNGTDFIAKMNFVIAPVLFIGEIFVCSYLILVNKTQTTFFIKNSFKWIINAILYSAYNLITAICVLISVIQTVKQKKYAKIGAMLGGFFITLLSLLIGLVIFLNYKIAIKYQIPMLAITKQISDKLNFMYGVIFFLAIFTTAIGNFFALYEMYIDKNFIYKLFISLSAIIFAQIKFSNLVANIYPLFGYIGLLEIFLICFAYYNLNK